MGEDELGRIAASLFQTALTSDTYVHYSSNLTGFFKFCELFLIDPLQVTLVDIARYIEWLGHIGTVATSSLTPTSPRLTDSYRTMPYHRSRLVPWWQDSERGSQTARRTLSHCLNGCRCRHP